jgi:hypothetical protein
MIETQSSRALSAKQAVEMLRSNMSNGELMQKFKISPKGFADLLTQLFEKKLISEQDLLRRGIRFKVQKKPGEGSATPKPLQQAPQAIKAPILQSDEPQEEFLDTIAIENMFSSFKPVEPPAPVQKGADNEISGPEEDIKIDESKKSGFFSGIFRKGG